VTDTIAAIASGMTASGIGIIRISGPEAFLISGKLFRFADSKITIENVKPNTVHYGFIRDGKATLDEALLLFLKAPHTYTAEDTVEIDCHGGPFVMRKILELVLKNGARSAEPGEFTKRAFLNGRIDLSEAEAVMDVIEAKSDDALACSLRQLSGSVKNEITDIRKAIISEVAHIEAALDDPEHMDLCGYPEKLDKVTDDLILRLQKMLSTFEEGKIIKEGLLTVILGKPNAGKSSILNLLAGEERAIVTDIEGTTRDTIEETIRLNGIALRVTDTAGIRKTGDKIEKIGVEKALETAERADLILPVFDSSRPLDENDNKILDFIRGRKAVVLLNKSDLPSVTAETDLRKKTEAPVILISAKENTGIEQLADAVKELFFSGKLRINEETMITSVRHKEAIAGAVESLRLVKTSIKNGMPEDFFSIDLMDAASSLGKITGEDAADDLIDTIFSKFCMGK